MQVILAVAVIIHSPPGTYVLLKCIKITAQLNLSSPWKNIRKIMALFDTASLQNLTKT